MVEQIDGSFRRIRGVVLRETPGAESSKNRANFYNVTIEVSKIVYSVVYLRRD